MIFPIETFDIHIISPIPFTVGPRPGADFEAAKVRRAVKAAAQRVKARGDSWGTTF